MRKASLLINAVGDLGVNRETPESIFAHVATKLNRGDIVFGQLERIHTERGTPQVQVRARLLQVHARAQGTSPRMISAYKFAGFNILSLAGNHCLDWGYEGLFDTIDALERNGIKVVGVGKNIEEARRPVILEREKTKIAFLAYNSILPVGYEAGPDRPGCAPLRVHTFYEALDWQPATPLVKVRSLAYRDDLEAMTEDIRNAKSQADIVMVSMHWGIHFAPSILADYQLEVGHAAIDAGADMIIGHHAHILKGIEVYKGKVIFYSLCNFAFDVPFTTMAPLYGFKHRQPEYPTYAFPPEARKTILAKCILSDKKIQRVSFLPIMINKRGQPEVLQRSDKRSDEVFNFMNWLCEDQKLGTKLRFEGDEVIIAT